MSSAVSTPARPSTPANPAQPSTPPTGTWRHPKLNEIVRRQNASTFTERNVRIILYNFAGIALTWAFGRACWNGLPNLFREGKMLHQYGTWIYTIVHLVFVYNVAVALLPLFRSTDPIQDIPLTPAQRKLLGLPPSSRPATPDTKYATPPRYSRTPTPLAGSAGSNRNNSGSPLSGKGRESPLGGSLSGSPFSPSASPLLQKAMAGGLNGTRRNSYGSSFGPGVSRISGLDLPATPTPKTGTVGLNSKWLYDRERRNSGSARLYT
ncbi:Uncharacterized protein BP5553_00921 [Venustampulla echinocandica]|uniref:Nuclear pore complex component n=1 Tax=Venustampulla echinocandica TaxID=2656787 RepID=A0A370TZI3_9HELO|nr:Uncharacterized protein BP5553_00921 [Venustampulla echinocandica]RDL40942.1 Uncharacterized protein BP5553_00921 [Venustampulla echinocandica]